MVLPILIYGCLNLAEPVWNNGDIDAESKNSDSASCNALIRLSLFSGFNISSELASSNALSYALLAYPVWLCGESDVNKSKNVVGSG